MPVGGRMGGKAGYSGGFAGQGDQFLINITFRIIF